jgi:dihydrofolate reductase
MWTTLDGYVAGPYDEMGWLAGDEDMAEYETALTAGAEALLLGRTTHEDFAGTWPRVAHDESETPANRAYAQRVDTMPKLVVSRTGKTAEWGNSQRVESLHTVVVNEIKHAGDGYLVIYGSLSVVAQLQEMNMIDEYHLLMHPTAIGEGKALFAPAQSPVRLQLRSAEPFTSGVMLLRYESISQPALPRH